MSFLVNLFKNLEKKEFQSYENPFRNKGLKKACWEVSIILITKLDKGIVGKTKQNNIPL